MVQLTDEQFATLTNKLDENEDEAGRLIKDSTLRWLIDEALQLAIRPTAIVIYPGDFQIWRDWIESGDIKELYRCWDMLAPGCLDEPTEEDDGPV